jgi:hypothetical protein
MSVLPRLPPLRELPGARHCAGEQQLGVGPGQLERAHAEGGQVIQDGQVGDAAHHQQLPVPLAGPRGRGHRVADPRVVVASRHSQLSGQVVRPDGQHVHAVERGDRVGAGHARGCLDQDLRDRRPVQHGVQRGRRSRPHAELRHRRQLRALPARGEAARPGDRPRLIGRVYPGRDDALRAAVEQPPDRAVVLLRDTDERCQAKIAGGRAQLGGDIERHGRVLEIDHHRVVSSLPRDAHHIGGPATADAEHQCQLPVPQAVEERVPAAGIGLRIQHDFSSP